MEHQTTHASRKTPTIHSSGDVFEQQADHFAAHITQTQHQEQTQSEVPAVAENYIGDYIGSLDGGGQPLSEDIRMFFENRMGQDLQQVRVHTDSEAAASSKMINANAFTTGNHIVFNEGKYAPQEGEGKRLLAHELTHVAQQGVGATADGASNQTVQREESDEDPWWGKLAGLAGEVGEATGIPILEAAGSVGEGLGGMAKGGDDSSILGGIMGLGKSAVDMAKYFGEDTLGEAGGTLGGIGGVLGVGQSLTEAYGDYNKGDYWGMAGDIFKGTGEGLKAAAEFGGVEMGGLMAGEAGAGLAAGGAAAAGEAGLLIGSGVAGWEAGKLLDKGVNWLGQTISGDDKGDYSISGGLASGMTSVDQVLTPLWADPSKPEYTQTLGWKLGEWLGI